jgi:uncharacterized protein YdaU (DUF1376 family)
MPLWVADFVGDTLELDAKEIGAYMLILMAMWGRDGYFPHEEKKLQRIARCGRDWPRVWASIRHYFTVDGDKITQDRLLKELQKVASKREVNAQHGARGGRAKALKNNMAGLANASVSLKQPEPYPEPDIKERDTNVSLVLSAPEPASPIAEAVRVYNETADATGWPKVQTLSPARSKALKARLRDCGGIEGWRVAMDKGKASDFLCGRTPKVWTGCGFDWITKQANFAKLMEGNYDNRDNKPQRVSQGGKRADPALEQILRLTGLSQASVNGGGGVGGFGEEDGSFRLGS